MDFKAGLVLKEEDLMILRTFFNHKYLPLKFFLFHCLVLALICLNQKQLSAIQLDSFAYKDAIATITGSRYDWLATYMYLNVHVKDITGLIENSVQSTLKCLWFHQM